MCYRIGIFIWDAVSHQQKNSRGMAALKALGVLVDERLDIPWPSPGLIPHRGQQGRGDSVPEEASREMEREFGQRME